MDTSPIQYYFTNIQLFTNSCKQDAIWEILARFSTTDIWIFRQLSRDKRYIELPRQIKRVYERATTAVLKEKKKTALTFLTKTCFPDVPLSPWRNDPNPPLTLPLPPPAPVAAPRPRLFPNIPKPLRAASGLEAEESDIPGAPPTPVIPPPPVKLPSAAPRPPPELLRLLVSWANWLRPCRLWRSCKTATGFIAPLAALPRPMFALFIPALLSCCIIGAFRSLNKGDEQ